MITRTELFDALWTSREYGCPRKCSKCRRGGNCDAVNSRSDRFRRDAALLALLLDLRDLLAEAMLTRVMVADQLEQPAKPSPAWVWSERATSASGRMIDGRRIAHAGIADSGSSMSVAVTIGGDGGGLVELQVTLPAWSLSQCKRWVEQWVASQADAAVAAFEAAEGMR